MLQLNADSLYNLRNYKIAKYLLQGKYNIL